MVDAAKPVPRGKQLVLWGLVAVLTVVVAISALPSYFSGQWPWSIPLEVPNIKQIRALTETPLSLPGWELTLHREVNISGNRWSLAEYRAMDQTSPESEEKAASSFVLLLRPQPWHDDQPQVEWVDLSGSQGWQINDRHSLRFAVPDGSNQPLTITTQFFRGLNENGTFAVMQWYAWPSGGHPAPGRWFWADQTRQWKQQERMPWTAVSVLLPIEPVGNIRPYSQSAISIGQLVQSKLLEVAFSDS